MENAHARNATAPATAGKRNTAATFAAGSTGKRSRLVMNATRGISKKWRANNGKLFILQTFY